MRNIKFGKPTVTAPTPNAKTSVRLVTVTDTPACLRAIPIWSGRLRPALRGSFCMFDQHWTITNISSIPIPKIQN